MAFISSFITTAVIAVVIFGVAVCGVFLGKKLRDNKDAKAANESNS
jgi:NADH:ubiquinone oxidoreductase subunit 3 (subunit A)